MNNINSRIKFRRVSKLSKASPEVKMLQWSHKKELGHPVVAAVPLLAASSCMELTVVESLKSQTPLLCTSHH